MKLLEIKKLMFKYKKEDKEKAQTLMMLIDTIEKMAKEKQSDPDLFIKDGAKRYLKQLKDAEANGVDVKDEIEFIESLGILPKEMGEEETKQVVKQLADGKTKKDFGMIMKQLKESGANMKVASSYLKEILN